MICAASFAPSNLHYAAAKSRPCAPWTGEAAYVWSYEPDATHSLKPHSSMQQRRGLASQSRRSARAPRLRDDALALGVVAAAARAARHLQQLVVQQRHKVVVAAASQRRDDGRARRHVDARRERLGGEHHLQQALLETLLDQRLPACEHPTRGEREAAARSAPPLPRNHMHDGARTHSTTLCWLSSNAGVQHSCSRSTPPPNQS